jgi:hypothetical protein
MKGRITERRKLQNVESYRTAKYKNTKHCKYKMSKIKGYIIILYIYLYSATN